MTQQFVRLTSPCHQFFLVRSSQNFTSNNTQRGDQLETHPSCVSLCASLSKILLSLKNYASSGALETKCFNSNFEINFYEMLISSHRFIQYFSQVISYRSLFCHILPKETTFCRK